MAYVSMMMLLAAHEHLLFVGQIQRIFLRRGAHDQERDLFGGRHGAHVRLPVMS